MQKKSTTQAQLSSNKADTRRVIIMGAAGHDFHNFNMVYRDDPSTEVVAFTASQIPGIAQRRYPLPCQARTTRTAFP